MTAKVRVICDEHWVRARGANAGESAMTVQEFEFSSERDAARAIDMLHKSQAASKRSVTLISEEGVEADAGFSFVPYLSDLVPHRLSNIGSDLTRATLLVLGLAIGLGFATASLSDPWIRFAGFLRSDAVIAEGLSPLSSVALATVWIAWLPLLGFFIIRSPEVDYISGAKGWRRVMWRAAPVVAGAVGLLGWIALTDLWAQAAGS